MEIKIKEVIPTSPTLKETVLEIVASALENLKPEIADLSLYFASDNASLRKSFFPDAKIAPMFSEIVESDPPPWSSYAKRSKRSLILVVDSSRIGFHKEICLLEDIVRGLAHEISEYRVITEEEFSSRWMIFPPAIIGHEERLPGWLAIQNIVRDRLADILSAQNGYEREQFTGTMWNRWSQLIAASFSSQDREPKPVSGLFVSTLLFDRSLSLEMAGFDELSKKYLDYMQQALLSLQPKTSLAAYWSDYLLIRNAILDTRLRIIDLFETLQSYRLTTDML
jgi:hypothetical protein